MNDTKRGRRPAGSGYARGDETRLRIIEAAIERFGEAGFSGASTRDIAAHAGVNAPALQYYFESKEGLYRACAEHIADSARAAFEPAMRQARAILDGAADADALIDAFVALQDAIADRMLQIPCGPDQRLFFAREQAGHEPPIASDILQERLRKPLNDICLALVARITGTSMDDPKTMVRVFTLHGQLVVFHTAKRGLLSLLGWEQIDAARAALVKETVREQTRALLRMWSAPAA
ncbi:CerR family C-terminal domain-containing protein [Bordetella bronchialis]|uniref:TetR family transcriptional regulator n=1 Tax=Bordetella bronchialis TaxID=463025 RepID=A0A193FIE2_9BORD|nr:CerR family C-terminal domain-containing protein [Bordetella bronchialis]ANN67003.1 TetR family transcriptional regulator [Bordetella bronchialis]ANN72078.1 TetR family transcriptional regulator [Bordetella bronchialis]